MPHGNLHPQLVIPDRILFPVDHKANPACSILPTHKIRVFIRRLFNHKVINNPQMAPVTVAALSQHFVDHFRRDRRLPGVQSCLPFFYTTDLLFDRRQFGQR